MSISQHFLSLCSCLWCTPKSPYTYLQLLHLCLSEVHTWHSTGEDCSRYMYNDLCPHCNFTATVIYMPPSTWYTGKPRQPICYHLLTTVCPHTGEWQGPQEAVPVQPQELCKKEVHVFPPMCLPCPPDHCCANGASPTECLHLCLYIIGSGLRTVRHRNAMFL